MTLTELKRELALDEQALAEMKAEIESRPFAFRGRAWHDTFDRIQNTIRITRGKIESIKYNIEQGLRIP